MSVRFINLKVNQIYTGPTYVTSGLILDLDAANPSSYSGSGSTWYDLTAYNNDATLVNSPTYNSGESFSLNGTDQYISSIDASAYTDLTIEIWLMDQRSWAGDHDILTYNGNAGSYTFNPTSTPFRTDGNQVAHFSASPTIPTQNTWYRFCYVKNTAVWVNNTKTTGSGSDGAYGNLNFGDTRKGFDAVNTPLQGKIAVIHVYNRLLSDIEVEQNFNAIKGRYGL